jgi:hypothetical protein
LAKKDRKDGVFNSEKNQQVLNILNLENYSFDSNAKAAMNKITVNVNNNNDQVQNNNQNNEKYLEDFINNPS